jgi:hypothetical protein
VIARDQFLAGDAAHDAAAHDGAARARQVRSASRTAGCAAPGTPRWPRRRRSTAPGRRCRSVLPSTA